MSTTPSKPDHPSEPKSGAVKPSKDSQSVKQIETPTVNGLDKLTLKEAVKEQLGGLLVASDGSKEAVREALERVIEGVLSDTASRARTNVTQALTMAVLGETWGKSLDKAGLTWPMLSGLRSHNIAFSALMSAVEDIAVEACKQRRLKLADARAFDGVERFTKDGRSYLEYSDRLAELLIVGDDRAKYAPQSGAPGQGQGSSGPLAIQINVHLPSASSPVTTDITTIENPQ